MAASAPGTTSRSSLLLLPVILLIAAVGLGAPSSSLLPLAAAAATTVNGAANGRGVTLRIDRRQVSPLGPLQGSESPYIFTVHIFTDGVSFLISTHLFLKGLVVINLSNY